MNKRIDFKKISVHEGPKRSLGFLLWNVSTSWRSAIETVLKNLALTHPQFVVIASLAWLTHNGDLVTQSAIGKMAALDPNTISQILKGLESKGLIERIPSVDGRAKHPILTTKGQKVLKEALPAVERKDAEYFDTLTKKETEALIKAFQKLMLL